MYSVIIPACNEEAVITHCLSALTADMRPGEMQIIVACNACKDRTADLARGFAGVTVLETATPGKPNALNIADRVAKHFPRIYLDADVRISAATARELARVLRGGVIHAAAPQLQVDLEGRSWLLRSYYRIWMLLPYCTQGMVGSGVYALSKQGRARFTEFPAIFGDDEFIRLHFPLNERLTLTANSFTVASPTSFKSLLNLRSRWERTNRQIDATYADIRSNDQRDYKPFFRKLLSSPPLWPAFVVYVFAIVSSRLGAAVQLRFAKNPWEWSRDETARAQMGKSGNKGR